MTAQFRSISSGLHRVLRRLPARSAAGDWGHRLTLVYNLSRRGRHPLPSPPSYTAEQDRLSALLRKWGAPGSIVNTPTKLIYPLEHAYTGAGLSFESLKGADAARASVLVAAAAQADCNLHLALVTIEESGVAEYLDAYHDHRNRRRGRDIESRPAR